MALVLVSLDVSPQVGPVCKSLSTLVASIGLLSSVEASMVLEQPRPREGFLAYVTFEVADVSL